MISIHLPDLSFQWPTLSNEFVLVVNISLFLTFATAELIGALASGSLALLGDSICMFVDVSSYLCNTYVEWYKARHGRVTFGSRVFTEVVVPSFSVLSLVGVTVYMIVDAMAVVRDPPSENSVDVTYLYSFSIANLVVDILCNGLFMLKGQDAFHEDYVDIPKLDLDTSISGDDDEEFGRLDDDALVSYGYGSTKAIGYRPSPVTSPRQNANSKSGCLHSASTESHSDHGSHFCSRLADIYCCGFCSFGQQSNHQGHNHGRRANLNMLSAFSHLMGDTFRTISTFIAASVSSLTGIDGDICDAWAAIVVSVTIVIFCALLLWEIKDAALELWNEDCRDAVASASVSATRSSALSFPVKRNNSGSNGSSRPQSQPAYQRVSESEAEDASLIL